MLMATVWSASAITSSTACLTRISASFRSRPPANGTVATASRARTTISTRSASGYQSQRRRPDFVNRLLGEEVCAGQGGHRPGDEEPLDLFASQGPQDLPAARR